MIALPPEERCFSRYPDRLTCVLRRGHVGLHACGSIRWADDEALPLLAASLPPPPSGGRPSELLTAAEHRVMDLTVELWNLLAGEIVGRGRSRTGDTRELCGAIHAIQRTVLAQAACRAYPDRYRLLGGEIGTSTEGAEG